MLLRNRVPGIDPHPARQAGDHPQISHEAIALIRWLQENRVEYVLVGAVAEAARGAGGRPGPLAIVPAPYHRNLERLARALWGAHARLRVDTAEETMPIKVTAKMLAAGQPLRLRCGAHDLNVEARPQGARGYQELLYETTRIELAPGLAAEIASPEDIELYAELRRTGRTPEIRIRRGNSSVRSA